MDVKKIPIYLLSDLRQRGLSNNEISEQQPEYLFGEYCDWHGLTNWGPALINVLDELREANK